MISLESQMTKHQIRPDNQLPITKLRCRTKCCYRGIARQDIVEPFQTLLEIALASSCNDTPFKAFV